MYIMPRAAKQPTARRAYKTAIKTARYANKLARVESAPVRRERRRVAGNAFLSGAAKVAAPLLSSGIQALSRRAMSMISGQGDYDIGGITQNSLIGKMSPAVPVFTSNLNGSIRVVHREYIKDILSTTDFVSTQFPINPALPQTFPWLSRIAQNFEQYRIHGMIFEFKSGSSDSLTSTNTALGYVVGAVEYNSLAPAYTNKLEMENALFCSSTKPSLSSITAVECMPNQSPLNVLYTRTGFESIGLSDIRLYDLGTMNVATVGMQAIGSNIGELWCSYDIELYKTRFLQPGANIPTLSVQYSFGENLRVPLGTIDLYKVNTLGASIEQVYNTETTLCSAIFTFPPGCAGTYIFNYQIMGGPSEEKKGYVTRPFSGSYSPYINFVNLDGNNIYPNIDLDSKVPSLNQSQVPGNNGSSVADQAPNALSQLETFSFKIPNNNLSASFTFGLLQADLDKLTANFSETGRLGVCYITQTSPLI